MSANPLKYNIVNHDNVNKILTQYKDNNLIDYVKDLLNLIEYQRKNIVELNKTIVSLKHKMSWLQYDRPIEEYDTVNRKFIDKPPKSNNMSC